MKVSDDHVSAMRACLAGDDEESQRLHRQLIADGATSGYGQFLSAAFVTAVRRRFSPTWSWGEVIRYVAGLRSVLGGDRDRLDPLVAENLMRHALGDESLNIKALDKVDDETKAHAQLMILMALASDANFDDSALDDLLNSARKFAEQWQ
ncbi:hypothetical protein ABZ801_13375 [Actinomadura sp. NPDC047616]|uniref:hypothetical protein n=1 Tax=Actinomadura sp. NPDC047616 TaxID=3155914 RepID=UPI0033F7C70D